MLRDSARERRTRAVRRLARLSIILVGAGAVVAGLAALPAGAGEEPAPTTLPAQTLTNIVYTPPVPANTQGNRLDLFLPEREVGTPVPLFIWTSGSAWFSDAGKAGASTWANQLLPRGYAVAGVSVRSSFQAKFPGQLHDVKAAIRWLRFHAEEYGIDPNRFAISGNSSGGWTAAIAGVTGDVGEDLEGTTGITGVSSRVQAVVDFYGPTNFLLMDSQEPSIIVHDAPSSPESNLIGCAIQTCAELTERANPLNYVSDDDPPFLIFHGTADPLVPHGQSRILYEAMRERCLDVTFHSIPGIGHSHSYVTNTNQAVNQTVHRSVDCTESVTPGFEGGTAPNYAYLAAFLDRALTPAWAAQAVYNTGDRARYAGRVYEALWWTSNETPGVNPHGAWQELATAEDGTAIWTPSRIFATGDVVVHEGTRYRARWWTRNSVPGTPHGPWSEIPQPGPAPAWSPVTVYTGGEQVTYEGQIYEAQWWTYGTTPGTPGSAWVLVS